MSYGFEFDGRVLPKEQGYVERLVERLGFDLTVDEESGLVTATRPDVIEKTEFQRAAVITTNCTPYYGSVVWGALTELDRLSQFNGGDVPTWGDIPIRIIPGGWSGQYTRRLMVADTLEPTADWLQDGNAKHFWGMTERKIEVMYGVASMLPEILSNQLEA